MAIISRKICLLGDFGVGKTSLIRRFVDRQFSDQYLSTVGVKISRTLVESPSVECQQSFSLQLLIWDIEGSTKFKAGLFHSDGMVDMVTEQSPFTLVL